MSRNKVLVIDDCVFMLQIADDVITSAGFNAVMATNSIEANSHIFTTPLPLMILIDIEMPMLNGDKTAKHLKSMEFSRNIPLLLMSSKEDEEMQKLCKSSGADGYIIKPLTPEKFEKAVKQYCSP